MHGSTPAGHPLPRQRSSGVSAGEKGSSARTHVAGASASCQARVVDGLDSVCSAVYSVAKYSDRLNTNAVSLLGSGMMPPKRNSHTKAK